MDHSSVPGQVSNRRSAHRIGGVRRQDRHRRRDVVLEATAKNTTNRFRPARRLEDDLRSRQAGIRPSRRRCRSWSRHPRRRSPAGRAPRWTNRRDPGTPGPVACPWTGGGPVLRHPRHARERQRAQNPEGAKRNARENEINPLLTLSSKRFPPLAVHSSGVHEENRACGRTATAVATIGLEEGGQALGAREYRSWIHPSAGSQLTHAASVRTRASLRERLRSHQRTYDSALCLARSVLTGLIALRDRPHMMRSIASPDSPPAL